jgi:cellobiose transport system substrate-binding protein
MSVTKRRLRQAAAVALAAFTALSVAAACNKEEPGGTGQKPSKLIVDTFGEFGYDELVKQYTQQTGIQVELRKTGNLGDYRNKLVRYLATGKGAADVVALEEGIINEFKLNPANWVDLGQYMPASKAGEFLEWKWNLGKTTEGTLLGVPTDTGGLASCYRRDLFEAAGIAFERDQVSAAWTTWDDFIEVGKTYREKTGKGMLDSITSVTNAVLFQGQPGQDLFYDANDNLYTPGAEQKPENLIAAKSEVVKAAWDTAVKVLEANIVAKTQTWSAEWSAGFKNGTFAVTECPSWMTGIVEGNSGAENKGKWDMAAVPGGAGNWGGSWLAVPEQTDFPEEAAKLADFLTNSTSQIAAFKLKGPLPTNKTALASADFTGYTNAYFNNAPTAKIFGDAISKIQPIHLGPKHGAVKEGCFEAALNALQAGQLNKDAAWTQFLDCVPTKGTY